MRPSHLQGPGSKGTTAKGPLSLDVHATGLLGKAGQAGVKVGSGGEICHVTLDVTSGKGGPPAQERQGVTHVVVKTRERQPCPVPPHPSGHPAFCPRQPSSLLNAREWDFPGDPVVKNPPCNVRERGFNPWSEELDSMCCGASKPICLNY